MTSLIRNELAVKGTSLQDQGQGRLGGRLECSVSFYFFLFFNLKKKMFFIDSFMKVCDSPEVRGEELRGESQCPVAPLPMAASESLVAFHANRGANLNGISPVTKASGTVVRQLSTWLTSWQE